METDKKITLVLGASSNPHRPSYETVKALLAKNIPVIAVGNRKYEYGNFSILTEMPDSIPGLHTISIYLGPDNQTEYCEAILGLNPKRIIFNPGTRNSDLADMAVINGIEVINACTKTMLSNGDY